MKKKILVVEDEPAMISLICEMLEKAGYQTSSAEDGESALKAVKSGAPDLVLMDIILPKMDGWLVCQKMKTDEHLKKIPIILLSGLLTADAVADASVEKCDYLMAKPLKMDNLLEKVSELLERASSKPL